MGVKDTRFGSRSGIARYRHLTEPAGFLLGQAPEEGGTKADAKGAAAQGEPAKNPKAESARGATEGTTPAPAGRRPPAAGW
jgi:hypothetical protein